MQKVLVGGGNHECMYRIRPYLEMHPFDMPLPIRKFLTIAVVVAVSPDYVILDEPTAGQDLWGCAQLRKVMDIILATLKM